MSKKSRFRRPFDKQLFLNVAFLKSTLNFEYFEKNRGAPHLLYFRNYGLQKRSQIKVQKVPFQRMLREGIWDTCPGTVEICITNLLSYSLTTAKSLYLTTFSESVISEIQKQWGSSFISKLSKFNLDFKNAAFVI